MYGKSLCTVACHIMMSEASHKVIQLASPETGQRSANRYATSALQEAVANGMRRQRVASICVPASMLAIHTHSLLLYIYTHTCLPVHHIHLQDKAGKNGCSLIHACSGATLIIMFDDDERQRCHAHIYATYLQCHRELTLGFPAPTQHLLAAKVLVVDPVMYVCT
jgi:hypothetical protein